MYKDIDISLNDSIQYNVPLTHKFKDGYSFGLNITFVDSSKVNRVICFDNLDLSSIFRILCCLQFEGDFSFESFTIFYYKTDNIGYIDNLTSKQLLKSKLCYDMKTMIQFLVFDCDCELTGRFMGRYIP